NKNFSGKLRKDKPMVTTPNYVRAASVKELKEAGLKAVTVKDRVVLLVHHEGQIFALDNRCPHMGFPLERGSVKRGLLTCHWHHARFELCSGGTFDIWADDVRSYPFEIQEGDIWVNPNPERDEVAYQLGRLQSGLEQNIRLVLAKAVISLLDHDASPAELLKVAGQFGSQQRQAGWRDGLTILSAMANTLPYLSESDKSLALFHGMLHVANNVMGQTPHYELEPLSTSDVSVARLKAWLREFAEVRDRDGVERVLLTALKSGYGHADLADMLFAAVTDHYFLDTGHSVDFINKAFEMLDQMGWQEATTILPSIVPALTDSERMEETNSWQNPVHLAELLEPVFSDLLAGKLGRVSQSVRLSAEAFDALTETLLGSDPETIINALKQTLDSGVAFTQISLALSFAAAKRVARFHTSNEFGDWISVLHTFSSANATHQLLKRAPSLEGLRGVFHTAMHLYLNRFLNAPAARQPSAKSVEGLNTNGETLLKDLLELTNARENVEKAAAVTYRYLEQGHDDARLIQTLAHSLLREDGEFHSYQMLEAGIQLYQELKAERPEHAPTVLVAVARYLAGHAPTDRATTQTYRIASRLHAGEALAAD
ncbi:MAG: Rieske (2Fe-2S) protein, partial [Trueperaceae bacterium]|nr:Rieske (2Fe-2S) protein [Trueperaceae bacterium]